ncbi:hypothetical protein VSX64_06245 [Aurantimonas sp. C2-6-R+9]|uniref:hypothetical protein n=1 Tax=unclassified Aurantimonas TaxID=2638230 RepID=UPI002E17A04A|nr:MULTISPECIES: hypothetical protein [unclassified Aurantimonas]MEC5290503.1 hypothetical protein [Aurantimonas sp. C2-3-R2]MEC5325844.1 hypothetical protein [Aurantimonas sp. A3-2-R12]MEC5380488.1 hypothetical protein [Aurantimonas sp. C2-6-R+9]MEC5411534.1 hypothetical protein [Aurantimonas sp. C2-4-R8]
MKTSFFAALVAMAGIGIAGPALADPSGSYDISGVNPDGTQYEASVLVAKIGDAFTLTYTLGNGSKVSGTAIGDDDVLAIGYAEKDDTGVALMFSEDDKWKGVWTYLGAKTLGTEEWTPQ